MPSDPKITDSQYRIAAMRKHASDDLEIDDCTSTRDALVSRVYPDGGDGAWVKAWIWVRNEDAAEGEGDADV